MKEFISENKVIVAIVLAIVFFLTIDFWQYTNYARTLKVEIYKKQIDNSQLFKEFSSLQTLSPIEKLDHSSALIKKYQAYPIAYLLVPKNTIEFLYSLPQSEEVTANLSRQEKIELEQKTLALASLILELYKKNHKSMYGLGNLYVKAFESSPGLSSWLDSQKADNKIVSTNKDLDDKIKNHLSQFVPRHFQAWERYYEENEQYLKYSQKETVFEKDLPPIDLTGADGVGVGTGASASSVGANVEPLNQSAGSGKGEIILGNDNYVVSTQSTIPVYYPAIRPSLAIEP